MAGRWRPEPRSLRRRSPPHSRIFRTIPGFCTFGPESDWPEATPRARSETSARPRHWLLLLANVGFMAYSEGYRGFQLGYSPRLARRVAHIRQAGSTLDCVLAPIYAMGFYSAPLPRLLITYLVTLGIIVLILLFHQISQPWRGILDAGVVIGLIWGLIATWFQIAAPMPAKTQTTEEFP